MRKNILRLELSLLLSPLLLSGCSSIKNNFYTGLEYSVNEEGEIDIEGKITYNHLCNCQFLVIKNNDYDTLEYFLTSEASYGEPNERTIEYYDIFTGKEVIKTEKKNSTNNRSIISKIDAKSYLFATNNIKEEYTPEEVKEIFKNMKEIYNEVNNLDSKERKNKGLTLKP